MREKENESVCSEENEKLMYKTKKNSDIERANVSPSKKVERERNKKNNKRCTFDVELDRI